jgi:putative glycosyltransferase
MARPGIFVATTMYNSERSIRPFLDEMRRVLEEVDCAWEIIVVDDGSLDGSVSVCRSLAEVDQRVTLVELTRNFGQEPAMLEAMRQAAGDFVFLIDSDLEEPPGTLLDMLAALQHQATVDVIYGVQKIRRGSLQRTFFSWLFYRVLNAVSGVAIPNDVLTVRLMTRRYVDALLLHNERTIALAGLFALAGFEQRALPVQKAYKGYTSYTLMKRLALFLRYLIILSSVPANAITATGITTAILTTAYAVCVFWFTANSVEGWTALVLLVLIFNGLLLTGIGVCATYLTFIFREVKGRPLVIVKGIWNASAVVRPVTPIPRIRPPIRTHSDRTGANRG